MVLVVDGAELKRRKLLQMGSLILIYQLVIISIDFLCNSAADFRPTHPLNILIILLIQMIVIIINLISYAMITSHFQLQSGNLVPKWKLDYLTTFLTLFYLSLSLTLYIWNLKNSWSSNYGLSLLSISKNDKMNQSGASSIPYFPSGSVFTQLTKEGKEFRTIWTNGFISLFIIQRTLSVFYYVIYLSSTFIFFTHLGTEVEKYGKFIPPNLEQKSNNSLIFPQKSDDGNLNAWGDGNSQSVGENNGQNFNLFTIERNYGGIPMRQLTHDFNRRRNN